MTDFVEANEQNARRRFIRDAASGRLSLPVCEECGSVQYPVRDFCSNCLSSRVQQRVVSGAGTIVASNTLFRSNDPQFSSRLPLQIASVRLDAGPLVLVFLPKAPAGVRVQVRAGHDEAGRGVLTAEPAP
jgi:uncharacterized OB-fold protein